MKSDEHPVDIHPDKETAERQDLSLTPGRQEDVENASARANRAEDRDVTSLRPQSARRDGGQSGGGDAMHSAGMGGAGGGDDQGTPTTPADHPLREGL